MTGFANVRHKIVGVGRHPSTHFLSKIVQICAKYPEIPKLKLKLVLPDILKFSATADKI
jgi:hypothetical protein